MLGKTAVTWIERGPRWACTPSSQQLHQGPVHLLAALWRLSKSELVIAKRSSWTSFSSFLSKVIELYLLHYPWNEIDADCYAPGSDWVSAVTAVTAAREGRWCASTTFGSFIFDIHTVN